MTEAEIFVKLYKKVGIDIELEQRGDEQIIYLEAKTHEKLQGYSGFATMIVFDKYGKFLYQTFFE